MIPRPPVRGPIGIVNMITKATGPMSERPKFRTFLFIIISNLCETYPLSMNMAILKGWEQLKPLYWGSFFCEYLPAQ